MTAEDLRQELEKRPFIPLRLHLASGKPVDILYEQTACCSRTRCWSFIR